uniref:THO complex subunit 5 homolog n=1 Tax=Graphocephala atropunctata TaxID=36148 RepID=A0A1B6MH52_9HEMI
MGKETTSIKETKEMSIKKRKKEGLPDSLTKVANSGIAVTYEDVIEHEEKEALERDAEGDLSLFCTTCEEFRKLVGEIAALKTSNSPQAAAQIVQKRVRASLLFVTLKKLNRLEKFRTNNSREKLHKAKQQADSCHLQLENLLYEILHLQKEVTKCLQFKSKDEEIDLVAVEEFYSQAPEAISRPSVTRVDTHQQQLARLEWELKQRKQLALLCQDLQTEKEKVASEISRKQSQLDNLAPMLKEVLMVANPVQESLGLTMGPTLVQQKAAQLLPHPLYFLFVQADALREAGDKSISVKIEGDEEDAQRLKQTVMETSTPDDSDSDAQEDVSAKRHGHRKKSRSDRQEERKKQLLMAHPLTVLIVVTLKDGVTSISLLFSYLVQLHVVTVKPSIKLPPQVAINSTSAASKLLDSEHILTELFPEDYGDSSPNTANIYQLKQLGIESFNWTQLGRAYVWAQRVAGLNFVSGSGGESAVPPSQQVSQLSLPGTVQAIKRRLRARVALCAQLQTLESGRLPNIPEVRSCFPQKLLTELTQWTVLSWVGYQALGFTQLQVTGGCVSERDLLYKGTLTRDNARLTLAVAIKNCYPLLPPVFSLQAAYENKTIQATNNDSIRDIEREVNAYFKELVVQTKSVHNLLTAQLLRLIVNFDILLEASSNQDFPRDKIFVQSNRGRNRAWPFKQLDRGEGVFHFTQR